jgi:hypothetical protein
MGRRWLASLGVVGSRAGGWQAQHGHRDRDQQADRPAVRGLPERQGPEWQHWVVSAWEVIAASTLRRTFPGTRVR